MASKAIHPLHRSASLDTYEHVMTAGLEAALQVGVVRTTVKDITTRARISNSTFYELFGSADEILPTLREYAWRVLKRAVSQRIFDYVPTDPSDWLLESYTGLALLIDDDARRLAVEFVIACERRGIDSLIDEVSGPSEAHRDIDATLVTNCRKLIESGEAASGYLEAKVLSQHLWLVFASAWTARQWIKEDLRSEDVGPALAAQVTRLQRQILSGEIRLDQPFPILADPDHTTDGI